MAYKIVVTPDAEADLDNFISYLLFEKQNVQAASNLLDDFEETKNILADVATSLKYCENPKLKKLGYRRINFQKHSYFMLYRTITDMVIIDNIFHDLQDYENYLN